MAGSATLFLFIDSATICYNRSTFTFPAMTDQRGTCALTQLKAGTVTDFVAEEITLFLKEIWKTCRYVKGYYFFKTLFELYDRFGLFETNHDISTSIPSLVEQQQNNNFALRSPTSALYKHLSKDMATNATCVLAFLGGVITRPPIRAERLAAE